MRKIGTDERRARQWARHHLARSAADVDAAIADLVAMHSSDPVTPHLGLWARVPAYRADSLEQGLRDGRLWRLHAMRRTLWVVRFAEAPVFDGAAARSIAAKERRRVLGWVAAERDDAGPWLEALEQQALEAIRADPGVLTRTLTKRVPELATRVQLGSGKWRTEAAIPALGCCS